MPSWSIVCPAPTSRSSGGRSAVRTSSGTPAWCASTTAGRYSAAAVPLVQASTTGRRVALASPRPKNAPERSSMCDVQRRRPSRTSASTSGVERDPGEVHASVMPQRTSSSTNARSSRWMSFSAGKIVAMAETIVLLHGFSGTHHTWDRVIARLDAERYSPLAPDIRGHGAASDARPIGFDEVVEDVLGDAPERFALCGYSMGGRIAQHVALAAPERISRLVLVSTTAGIEDPRERSERRARDEALALSIEDRPIEEFVAVWRDQVLFEADPEWVTEEARADQRRNEPRALAAVLRGLGAGVMQPLWDRLGELTMPAVVLAGERDAKFRELGGRLAAALPAARFEIVGGAGHSVQLEAPDAVVRALTSDAQHR